MKRIGLDKMVENTAVTAGVSQEQARKVIRAFIAELKLAFCRGDVYKRQVYGGWRFTRPAQVIKTYAYTVQSGDTLWNVCSEAKLPEQDVRELVYQTMQDNSLKDAGKLEPGRIITIKLIRRN